MDLSQAAEPTAIGDAQSVTTEPAVATPATEPAQVTDPAQVAAPATPEAVQAEPAAPAYTPNFKVKVKDQEKEIDEMFRPLIKDAETEKKVKEIFEKAYGIDFVKEDRKSLKAEYEGFKGQVVPYLQEYHNFTSLRDKGNLGAALQVAGITDDQIFEYAVQKLEMEKNPHQANLYKQHTQQTLSQIQMEQELARYKQQEQQSETQKFQSDLNEAVGRYQDIATALGQKLGNPNAFMDEVFDHGLAQHNKGIQLTVEQAAEAVANKYRPFMGTSPIQQTQIQAAPAAAQAPRPATLPHVGSSNVSPVRKQVTSVEDLRALSRQA